MGFHCFFLFYMNEIWVWFRNWSSWIKRIEIKFFIWVVFCFCNEFIAKNEYKDDEVECDYSINLFSKFFFSFYINYGFALWVSWGDGVMYVNVAN